MKKLIYIFSALALAVFVVLNISCSKQRIFTIKYEGTVYDKAGNPVKGCHVTLMACYPYDGHNQCDTFTLGDAITDDAGHFKIKERSARSDRYWVNANAPGCGGYFSEGLPSEIHLK